MQYTLSEQNGIQIVHLKGKIMGGADENELLRLREEFVEKNKVKVVFDLEHLDWINSVGIGQLVSAKVSFCNKQGDLRLANVPKTVYTLLHKCRLTSLLVIYDSIEDAVASY